MTNTTTECDDWVGKNMSEAARLIVEYRGLARVPLKGAPDSREVTIRVFEYLPGALDSQAVGAGYRYYAEVETSNGDTFTGNPGPTVGSVLDGVHYRRVIPPSDPDS